MEQGFSPCIANLTPSASVAMMTKAMAMKKVDPTIVDLSSGEPDFDTPLPIREELFRQVSAGFTHYTPSQGVAALRERIAQKLREENGCHYQAQDIIVTPGGKFALYLAVRALIGPGDVALYLAPGWVSYPAMVETAGGTAVAVELESATNYSITLDQLEEAYTPNTKVLILNYPNNPTGCVLSEEEFQGVKAFLLNHPQVWLISDEIYEKIRFDGVAHISPGADGAIASRVITINGFSKSVAMTGWRIGYLAAAPAVVTVAMKLFSHTMSCTSGFVQQAALKAFDCDAEIQAMCQEYQARRDLFVEGLNQIPGVHCQVPQGAFYAWTSFDVPGMDSTALCQYLLEQAKVVGIPGVAYGDTQGCHIRFSFATSMDQLAQAVANIRQAMEGFPL